MKDKQAQAVCETEIHAPAVMSNKYAGTATSVTEGSG